MQKAKAIDVLYQKSDNITCQGTRRDVQRYLNDGYYVKEERNGYWVLVKPAIATLMLESEDGKQGVFNIKQDILNHYGRERITLNLINKFTQECKEGKFQFYMDDNSFCFEEV